MQLLKQIVRNTYPFSRFVRQRDEALRNVETLRGQIETLQRSPLAHQKPTFSHWGEDQVVAHFLAGVERGFYVDIGCFHPSLYSNTKLLHDRGWSGINIDPNPFMIQEFDKERPGEVNLNIAIGAEAGMTTFMLFHEWASSNTISQEWADSVSRVHDIEVARRIETQVHPLRDVLDKHARGRHIDFMNIDIESVDIEALESNDWSRYRPTLLAIEDFEFDFRDPRKSKIYEFLVARGYSMVSRCVLTSFFQDQGNSHASGA